MICLNKNMTNLKYFFRNNEVEKIYTIKVGVDILKTKLIFFASLVSGDIYL